MEAETGRGERNDRLQEIDNKQSVGAEGDGKSVHNKFIVYRSR